MEGILRSNSELKKIGWSWDYEQMQSFQEVIYEQTGEQISLEQIDAMLNLLYAKKCLCNIKEES